VADNSVDVIISNCVINLSLDKAQVFKEAFRVLRTGGRLSISDVVAIAEMPEKIRQNLNMISACIGGAEHVDVLKKMLQSAGFTDIKLSPKDNSAEIVKAWAPESSIENYVASYIIEAIKK
jgi:ubiquinone/menaquinone biosynthesis C-methylase UbiE